MDDPTYVTFVDTHAKSDCRTDYIDTVVDKILLCVGTFLCGKASVIGNSRDMLVVGQLCGQVGSVISFHAVDDATGAWALPNETGDGGYLLPLIEPSAHIE